jgi:hypothetical protein
LKVPLSELLSGYSREADYRHKTQSLAEERRKWEAERDAAVQEEVQKLLEEQAALEGEDPEKVEAKVREERLARLEAQQGDLELERLLDRLKKDHPKMDEDKFLIALSRGELKSEKDFYEFAKKSHEDYLGLKQKTFEEFVAEKENPAVKQFREKVIAEYLASKNKLPHSAGEAGGAAPVGAGTGSDGKSPFAGKDVMGARDAAIAAIKAGGIQGI